MTKFEKEISNEEAYRLICLFNTDEGGRDAISARGWLIHSSWYNDVMTLTDGSYIVREPFVDGHLIHSNITPQEVMSSLLN